MTDRIEKFKAKISGDVRKKLYDNQKKSMVKQEAEATNKLVKIEEQVKAILPGISTIYLPYYIIFGKEINRVLARHKSETALSEICLLCRKWHERGLDPINLNKVAILYTSMACFDVKECDYPAEADVKDGVIYDDGNLTGTLECPPEYGLPKTGQTTSYQDGDDGDYEKGYPLTPPRFTDNGDGTITDNATGLMWIKDPIANPGAPFNAKMTWENAIINCEALNFAGHDDWRLPNIKELISITDYGLFFPAIDPVFFPNTQLEYYWSSTTCLFSTGYAWNVDIYDGLSGTRIKTATQWVRPVRLGKPL